MKNTTQMYGFLRERFLLDASKNKKYSQVKKLLEEFIPAYKIEGEKSNKPTNIHELMIDDLDLLQFFIKLLDEKKFKTEIYEIITTLLSNDCFFYDFKKLEDILENLFNKADYKTLEKLLKTKNILVKNSQIILKILMQNFVKDSLKILENFKQNNPNWKLLSLLIEIKKTHQQKLNLFDSDELDVTLIQLGIIANFPNIVDINQLFTRDKLTPIFNLALSGNHSLVKSLLKRGVSLDLTIRPSGKKNRTIWIEISNKCHQFENATLKEKPISQQQYENYKAILTLFNEYRDRSDTVAMMYQKEKHASGSSNTSSLPDPERTESSSSISTDYSLTPENKPKHLDIEEFSVEDNFSDENNQRLTP